MAYEPTQWRSGDTITSERLNKMEQGIANSGVFKVTVNATQSVTESFPSSFSDSSASYSEILDAYNSGLFVYYEVTLTVDSSVRREIYYISSIVPEDVDHNILAYIVFDNVTGGDMCVISDGRILTTDDMPFTPIVDE